MASSAAASSSKDRRNSVAMEADDASAVNRFDDFAAVSVRTLNKQTFLQAEALFIAKEAERVVVDGEMECIENVQVVLISERATPEDIARLQEKFSVESKGVYLAVEDGVLFIYKVSGNIHADGVVELCRQVGNHLDPYVEYLGYNTSGGHAAVIDGIQPDVKIFPVHGQPGEPMDPTTREGSPVVVIELEDGNRNARKSRQHGHRLFDTGGNRLRIFITIKVYPERLDGTRAVLAVMYGRNAAHAVEFRSAMSIGTADVDPGTLASWQNMTTLDDLPPIGPVVAALHPLPATLTIPAADIWFDIHDAAGAVVDMPGVFADLHLDLRVMLRRMRILRL